MPGAVTVALGIGEYPALVDDRRRTGANRPRSVTRRALGAYADRRRSVLDEDSVVIEAAQPDRVQRGRGCPFAIGGAGVAELTTRVRFQEQRKIRALNRWRRGNES